jgi:hypothetical protein
MKRYMLLRKNRESGPYTLEELMIQRLRPNDLLWEEGESTSWKFPLEMEELRSIVDTSTPEEENAPSESGGRSAEAPREWSVVYYGPSSLPAGHDLQEKQAAIARQFRESQRRPQPKRGLWKREITEVKELFTLAFVFIGVVLGSVIMKKVIDNLDRTTYAGTQSEFTFSRPQLPEVSDPSIQNALTMEFIPAKDTTTNEVPSEKQGDIRKLVRVNDSGYKVGLLGGIRDLELNVYNGSEETVEEVVVEVQFLRANGEVTDVRQFTAEQISPFRSRVITIPPSDRGVKVNYKIINVSLKQQKTILEEA